MVARAGSLCPACHPRAHIDTLDENAKRRITLFCSCFTFLVRHDFSNCDTEATPMAPQEHDDWFPEDDNRRLRRIVGGNAMTVPSVN
jgi:hypothetical protein